MAKALPANCSRVRSASAIGPLRRRHRADRAGSSSRCSRSSWMMLLALKNDAAADHHLLPVQPDLVELRDGAVRQGHTDDQCRLQDVAADQPDQLRWRGDRLAGDRHPCGVCGGPVEVPRQRRPDVPDAVVPVRARADGDRAAVRDLQPDRLVRHQSRHDLGAAAGHDAAGGVDPALVLPRPAQRISSRPPCSTVTPASGRS